MKGLTGYSIILVIKYVYFFNVYSQWSHDGNP